MRLLTQNSASVALVVALAAAGLEASCAGRGVSGRLRELYQPPRSPKLWVWVLLGIFYYVTCFAVSYRLLTSAIARSSRAVALALLLALMFMNAVWNFFFFRRRDLATARRLTLLYAGTAWILVAVLFYAEASAGWLFLPYALYLIYGTWWTLAVVTLNAPRAGPG